MHLAGTRHARDAGVSAAAVAHWQRQVPVLGVCLGMQVINEMYGGRTVHAPVPVHGKADAVRHDGTGLFAGIPSPFRAARYHSLVVERRSDELRACAWTEDGSVMALSHVSLSLHGVQFHPESFLTEHGAALAAAFLRLCHERDTPSGRSS